MRRKRGVAVVSAVAEEFAAALPAEVRGLVERAAADPAGAEEFFAGFDADAMLAMVTRPSPVCDLAVYQDPAFAAAYRRALEEGFGQGAASGYARDTLLVMGRWPFALEDVTVPVDVWYGDLGTSHSPDHGRHLTARIPDARRHTVPDAGGSLFWTHPAPILTSLLTRTGRVTPHSADRHRPSAAPG